MRRTPRSASGRSLSASSAVTQLPRSPQLAEPEPGAGGPSWRVGSCAHVHDPLLHSGFAPRRGLRGCVGAFAHAQSSSKAWPCKLSCGALRQGGLQAILSRDGVAGNSRKWRRGEGGTASEWCCCTRNPAVLVAGNRVASQLAVACWPASAAGVKWPRHILRPRVCSSPAPARCRLPAWEQARQPLAREACHTTCPARAARRGLTQTRTLVPAWPPRFETTRRMTPRRSRSGSHTCAQQLRRAQRSARCPRRLRHPRPGPKLVARAYPLIPGPARLKQSCGALGNGGRDQGRGLGGVRNCQAAQQ